MKIERARYIGCSVVLCASSKFAPYRQRAVQLIADDFRAHSEVREHVAVFKKRRGLVYAKIISALYSADDAQVMVGKTPADYRTCFTVGGSADHPMDNQALEGLFDCILDSLGLEPTSVFDKQTGESFRKEAVSAIRQNKLQLGFALNELEKEERQFDLADDEGGEKLYKKLRVVVPNDRLLKDEIREMAYSVAHAASNGIDAVYITSEDDIGKRTVLKKIGNVVSQVLRQEPDVCPQVAHVSETYF